MNKIIEESQENWDKKVITSESLFSTVGRNENEEALSLIINDIKNKMELTKSNKILEIGCGTGILLSKLNDYVSRSCGIDFSFEAIQVAKTEFPNIEFIHSEANNIPFESDTFDKVLCYGVFHYFSSMNYALSVITEILRVCKSGGTILLGDIPSKKHFHLSPYVRRISISSMYTWVKNYMKRLTGKTIKKPFIINPRKWQWYDLDKLIKHFNEMSYHAQVLKQPDVIQWFELTNNHRFDVVINI